MEGNGGISKSTNAFISKDCIFESSSNILLNIVSPEVLLFANSGVISAAFAGIVEMKLVVATCSRKTDHRTFTAATEQLAGQ